MELLHGLACKTLVKDLDAFTQMGDGSMGPGKEITVEPIKGLPVLKDLVVDMEPFFDAYRSVMPFLITSGEPPTRERRQSAADRQRFEALGMLAFDAPFDAPLLAALRPEVRVIGVEPELAADAAESFARGERYRPEPVDLRAVVSDAADIVAPRFATGAAGAGWEPSTPVAASWFPSPTRRTRKRLS